MKRSPSHRRTTRATPAHPATPSRTRARREALPSWGDLHPLHRVPTFLEAAFFEGDASAITARLDRLS